MQDKTALSESHLIENLVYVKILNMKKFTSLFRCNGIPVMCSLLLCMLISCTPRQKANLQQRNAIDTFLINRYDSIYTYPALMEQRFRTAQTGLTDSSAYYKLELFSSYCLFLQGYADSALWINRRIEDYCHTHTHSDALEAQCWNHRFAILQALSQRDSAIACLHHAYNALMKSDDYSELENICINLADQYRQKGELANASRYYRRALWLVDSLGSERIKFSIYTGLAQVYADLHNFNQAHYYFDMAEHNPEPRLHYENYIYFNSKGNCYYFEEKYPEALACFKQAYEVCRQFNQPSYNALIEANIGEIFTLMNCNDSAHHYLNKAYTYFKDDLTTGEEVMFYLNSLQAALALNENRLDLVNYYLSQPYDSLKIGPLYMYLHNKRFMEYYARKGDFTHAYRYRVAMNEYDDSMRNLRHINNIAEIDYRYRQDTTLLKRDIMIAHNREQLSTQRNTLMLVLSLLIISILGAALIIVHINRKNEREYSRQLTLVSRLRMENVKNRISPHYVFNVLNAVMPVFKQYPDLSHLLRLFIQVLRGNLLVSDQISVTLANEIELVKNYVTLRQEITPNTPPTKWEIDSDVPLQMFIPSMSIQIPVENALKYAFGNDESPTDAYLLVRIKVSGQGIVINIRDNGCGYDPGHSDNSERGTGIGLKMLFRTIELLNGKNTEPMKFNISNLSAQGEQGTLVSLYVPFNYQFKL